MSVRERVITVDGITVYIKRKRIKNIYLRVSDTDGRVTVSVPCGVDDVKIRGLLEEKRQWLREKTEQAERTARAMSLKGQRMMLWGKEYTVCEGLSDGRECVKKDSLNRCLYLTVKADTSEKRRCAAVREFLRRETEEMLVRRFEPIKTSMGYDEEIEYSVRYMRSKHGCCNTRTRKLVFSSLLAQLPTAFLDYVIIHELAHLRYTGHGADFYSEVAKYMKNYKDVIKQAKVWEAK